MTTITREQFEAAIKALPPFADTKDAMRSAFAAAGITIAEPEPPAAMVRLAREIVAELIPEFKKDIIAGHWDDHTIMLAALAALQRAAKVARDAPGQVTVASIAQRAILRALGAIA